MKAGRKRVTPKLLHGGCSRYEGKRMFICTSYTRTSVLTGRRKWPVEGSIFLFIVLRPRAIVPLFLWPFTAAGRSRCCRGVWLLSPLLPRFVRPDIFFEGFCAAVRTMVAGGGGGGGATIERESERERGGRAGKKGGRKSGANRKTVKRASRAVSSRQRRQWKNSGS